MKKVKLLFFGILTELIEKEIEFEGEIKIVPFPKAETYGYDYVAIFGVKEEEGDCNEKGPQLGFVGK